MAYLTTLDLGGLVPSIIAGNASIILFALARRALSPAALARMCLALVAVGGIVMTMAQDGHGVGIIIGIAAASLVLARQRLRLIQPAHEPDPA